MKRLFGFTWDFSRIYASALFLLIFIYLLLRAAWLAPLHDESATFLFYIEPECVVCEGIVQDANNHLLNSYLGTAIYHFFGESFFLLRLPNILAFAVYFLAAWQLVKPIRYGIYRVILLTALTTVPYMDEYFAYTRGYGLAIAFFAWMLVYSRTWLENASLKHAALLLLFSLLAIFSNLVFLVPGCLAPGLILLVHLRHWRDWKAGKQLAFLLLYLLFFACLYPFAWFSYLLRTGGALYYGSLDGFWNVTGRSLSRYVLFNDADWQQWIWILLIAGLISMLIHRASRRGMQRLLKDSIGVWSWYFLGSIVAILLLAKLFHVHYPEDRAGMYLIPLTILVFGFSADSNRFLRPLAWLLLFFPVTFLLHMSFQTSVFTPDERISDGLYKAVRQELRPGRTLAVYHTMSLNWALKERKMQGTKLQPIVSDEISPLYDAFVNKKSLLENADLSDYRLIFEDQASGNAAYRRIVSPARQRLMRQDIPDLRSSARTILLSETDIPDSVPDLLIQVRGMLHIGRPYRTVQLRVATLDGNGNEVRMHYFDQRWCHGKNMLTFEVAVNDVLSRISGEEKKLRLYIWNPESNTIGFTRGGSGLYKIKA